MQFRSWTPWRRRFRPPYLEKGRALLAEVERETKNYFWMRPGGKSWRCHRRPSGAGKSTLLNALAGRQLSTWFAGLPPGRSWSMPPRADANINRTRGRRSVRNAPRCRWAGIPTRLIPRHNTIPENQRLLAKLLERADILLAIFPAHNPKMHDNITFLAPFVRQLPSEAIIPALNMVDRAPRDELERDIVPDFLRVIRQEWQINPEKVYLLSAKASAPGEAFPPDETPLHAVNEFAVLRRFLFEALNQAGQVADRRMAQAEHLLDVLRQDTCRTLEQSAPQRQRVADDLADLHAQAQRTLAQAMSAQAGRGSGLDLHTPRHVRSTLVGSGGLADCLRGRGPASAGSSAIWAAANPLPLSGARRRNVAALPRPSSPWFHHEQLYSEQWPPIADALVQVGFDLACARRRSGSNKPAPANRCSRCAIYEEHLARLAVALSAAAATAVQPARHRIAL